MPTTLSSPELRTDLVSGHSVIMAPARLERPGGLTPSLPPSETRDLAEEIADCPFCLHDPPRTPPTVLERQCPSDNLSSHPSAAAMAPHVRIVPNLYPAVDSPLGKTSADRPRTPGDSARGSQTALCTPAWGRHEVVIETTRHIRHTTELTLAETTLALECIAQRVGQWRTAAGRTAAGRTAAGRTAAETGGGPVVYALPFQNVGLAAGASQPHVHSQLLGLSWVPPVIRTETEGAARFYQQHRRCVFCHLVQAEIAADQRIVIDSDHFLVFCPFASRLPFETWIVPKRHCAHFDMSPVTLWPELAKILRRTIATLNRLYPNIAYNSMIHSLPFDTHEDDHYHWHVELLPRLCQTAGFEWGSGTTINPVCPESAACALRAVDGPATLTVS